jgi:glycosyltransferase involved in cell wall biosynthesis
MARRRFRDLRIMHFIDSGGFGGIERHVETLCRAQRAAGHDACVLIYADHGSSWPDSLMRAGAPFAFAGGARGVLARLRAQHPDVVHTHGYKAGIVGRIICRLLSIPVVSTYHAGERAPFPVSLYQRIDEASAFLCPRIAVSKAIAARLPAPSTVINNFVLPAQIDFSGPSPARIAFVGRLSFEKGPDLFCDLAARSAQAGEEWVVYGDGPMRADLEAAHAERVVFQGLVADMDAQWTQVGLLIMTSRAEGLPYAALEALAHGVPVLACAVGGLPDLLSTHPEWLLSPNDTESWLAAVEHWRRARTVDPGALRAAALAILDGAYSPDVCLAQIFNVYGAAGVRC